MAAVYDDYGPDRVGFFFGLTGARLATLTLAVIPVFVAVNQQRWLLAAELAALAAVVTVLVVVPVRGRSATGWLLASLSFAVGRAFGWTSWRSKAATGKAEALENADLPGVMTGIEVHDGAPKGPSQTRYAIIQDHGPRTWAMTAAIRHPGVGMAEGDRRDQYGRGLTELLDVAARASLISDVVFLVRTVPDDGAERQQWIATHRRPDGPELARRMNDELATALTRAAVRTEAFVSFVVPETRIAKQAREFGGGLEGRTRVLYALADEISAMLRGGMGMTDVAWLTSPQLALAVRTGFAPADRAGIIDALAAHQTDPAVCTEVPWAMAGPSGADTTMRHYSHDAWNSISSTIKLPDRGACLGALAPVLTPSEPGERRSYTVVFPILPFSRADRQTASGEWAADVLALYEAAATRYGLPWTLLAGVGMEETNHGRNNTTSSAGARGLMQFMPATFAAYGVDGNGDGRAVITDDADSVHSAANYLVASGALSGPDGVRKALFAYNHALWYVNDVLYYAAAYSGGDVAENPCVTDDTATTGTPLTGTGPATDAVNAALRWIGTRYSWGGGTPSGPSTGICCSPGGQDGRVVTGFDCSGLVLYAYAQIGVRLPHLAHDITYNSGGQVIPRDFAQMRAGDVIGFSYTPGGRVFHAGIYMGDGRMVNSDGSGVSIDSLTAGYYSPLVWRVVRFVE